MLCVNKRIRHVDKMVLLIFLLHITSNHKKLTKQLFILLIQKSHFEVDIYLAKEF